MKSLQLLIGVICLGVFIGYSSAIDVLKINKISLLSSIEITIEDTAGVGTADTIFTLIVGEAGNDVSDQKYYSPNADFTPGKTEQTLVFDFKGHEDFSKKNNFFLLIGEKDKLTILEASLLIHLNVIPKNEIKSKIVGETSLRIKDNLIGWEICNDANTDTVPLNCKGDTAAPCYALDIGASTTATYTLCSSTETTPSVPVIVKLITVEEASSNPTPTLINLEYGPTTYPSTAILHIESDIESGKGETVFYNNDKTLVTICGSDTECSIDSFTPSDSSNNIILVKKVSVIAAAEALGSIARTFQDSTLEVFALETTILETRWLYHTNLYTAELTTKTGADSAPFHTVNADCTTHTNGFCYAYYVNVVAAASYTVEVKPKADPETDDLNKITSAVFAMSLLSSFKVADNLLKNITIDKRYKEDSGDLELNICYSHDSTHGLKNTQLEVILISPSRQWRRIIEKDLQKADQRPCYSNTYTLDSDNGSDSLLTALVIQRNVTSHNVLSLQRMDLNHSANRAIKPEVENGSKGSASTLSILGAAVGGIACLMALVAAAIMFVMKIKRDNDGLQYPLHRTNIEQDSSYIHGLDNPIPTM